MKYYEKVIELNIEMFPHDYPIRIEKVKKAKHPLFFLTENV